MKILGINSPGIFLLLVIILSILGPKRIEKGWLLFQRLLKFLLSKEEDFSKVKANTSLQLEEKSEASVVKEPDSKEKSEANEVKKKNQKKNQK